MKTVGIRDLKAHASAIVRDVWENNETYVITIRGKRAAILCPLTPAEKYLMEAEEAGA